MVGALSQEQTPDEAKDLVNEDTHPTSTPKNTRIHKGTTFPKENTTFRANVKYGGAPWFDFGWVSVEEGQAGSEVDLVDKAPEQPGRRVLVQFWGFCTVSGTKWALCDYYRKYVQRRARKGQPPIPQLWNHPLLRRYEHLPHRCGGGDKVHSFFAVPVSAVIAAACVFPGVDQGRGVEDFRLGRRVTYTPRQVELFGGTDWFLPGETLIPEPTQEQLDSVGEYEHVSSSDSSDDGDDSVESESESSSEEEEQL